MFGGKLQLIELLRGTIAAQKAEVEKLKSHLELKTHMIKPLPLFKVGQRIGPFVVQHVSEINTTISIDTLKHRVNSFFRREEITDLYDYSKSAYTVVLKKDVNWGFGLIGMEYCIGELNVLKYLIIRAAEQSEKPLYESK